jgi:hypothetical protein
VVEIMTSESRLARLLEAERVLTEINREPRTLFGPAELEATRQILFIVRRWVNDQLRGGQ